MNKKRKWSETEIERLCSDFCHQIKERNHSVLPDSLRQIRTICGVSKCGCSSFSPAQKLSQLVRVQIARGRLVDYSVGLSIISNYDLLSHHSHCLDALENLLERTLKSDLS